VKLDESKRYEPPTLASIKLSAREKEEMNKIQDLIDILHTTDHDWIEDLEIIPPLKPQKITRQQKSDHAALLMTPPTTPEYPEQSESPEMNQNEGQTPPETLPSSLGVEIINLNLHGEHVNPTQKPIMNFAARNARKLVPKGRRKCPTKTYAAVHLLPITII
jgi:hypothetical protein